MISQFTNNYQALYNWNLISFDLIHKCIFFCIKISIFIHMYRKTIYSNTNNLYLMLLFRVHIVIERYTAGCQQTFCWWQPVVTRHFASYKRLSPDILLVTNGCQQTKSLVTTGCQQALPWFLFYKLINILDWSKCLSTAADNVYLHIHVAWFSGSDITNHTTRRTIAWLSGSDVRTSSNFTWLSCNCNGTKWLDIHTSFCISLSYNKTSVNLCFGRHEV